jgi:osmoprotectant transport system substrate-binding protein
VLLNDDKGFYPVYNIAPVVRMDTLQKYPQIADVLNKLAPLLTTDIMSGLNWQVDGPDKKEPAAVAKAFLQQHGLLK